MTSNIDIELHLVDNSYWFAVINEYDKRFKVSLSSTNVRVIDVDYLAWGKRLTMALLQKAHGCGRFAPYGRFAPI